MTPFDIATNDIFENPDFADTAEIGGKTVTVLASSIAESAALTEFGMDEGVSFFLRVRKADLKTEPKKNDIVLHHGERFRIASVMLDSAALVYKIDLKSMSTP